MEINDHDQPGMLRETMEIKCVYNVIHYSIVSLSITCLRSTSVCLSVRSSVYGLYFLPMC